MKTYLLIFIISTHAGQQPVVQKLEQPDMASCQTQAKAATEQLRQHGCGMGCDPGYVVRTSCVTGN
jgi:hypothetical protein